jgi:hypothetical protein
MSASDSPSPASTLAAASEADEKVSAAQQAWGKLNPLLAQLAPGTLSAAGAPNESAADLDLLSLSANMGQTSESHPLDPVFIRHAALNGKLGLVQCPGRVEPFATYGRSWARSLEQDVAGLQREGVHVIVSLVQASEAAYMKVVSLLFFCRCYASALDFNLQNSVSLRRIR